MRMVSNAMSLIAHLYNTLRKKRLAVFGKVHLVCCNAGVGCGGPVELITPGDWDWVIGVNLMGFVHVIQAFLPRLKEQGEGGHS